MEQKINPAYKVSEAPEYPAGEVTIVWVQAMRTGADDWSTEGLFSDNADALKCMEWLDSKPWIIHGSTFAQRLTISTLLNLLVSEKLGVLDETISRLVKIAEIAFNDEKFREEWNRMLDTARKLGDTYIKPTIKPAEPYVRKADDGGGEHY